ncbi:hypothetical protein BH23BAC4_BH23BAC4_07460 [soil metagenome]
MSEREIRAFHESFARCMANKHFFDNFYEAFLSNSEDVRRKLEGIDPRLHKRELRISLLIVVTAVIRKRKDMSLLEPTAATHSHTGRNIEPHLDGFWLNALLRSVEKSDTRFSEEIEKLWRQAFEPAVNYMSERY